MSEPLPSNQPLASAPPDVRVSIIIAVFNKLAFTRQCLDRLRRNTDEWPHCEVIVVDNGSTDGTFSHFSSSEDPQVRYVRNDANLGFARANNLGAGLALGRYLLFLNNDTLVQPGWLSAMLRTMDSGPRIGVVGIKQLFPYTRTIHHTGIIFTADGLPQHIYPHSDATLPHVSREREYQAVTGACLLIPRRLFLDCGGFDEGYVNGYEDVDLCQTVRGRGLKVICCTSAFIYHYGQITETRTADDDANARRFLSKWRGRVDIDQGKYVAADRSDIARSRKRHEAKGLSVSPRERIYFADDLSRGSALAWVTIDFALALRRLGADVRLRRCDLPRDIGGARRKTLESMMLPAQPAGGIQIKWSHYWPRHLRLDLHGAVNLELFVTNYLFAQLGSEPLDYWMQCLTQNGYHKLPLSGFCREALVQVGVPPERCHVVRPGYSPEALSVPPPRRRDTRFRFLTVTNSHDLERYGTRLLLDAYWEAFSATDDVVLVMRDYGAVSGDTTLKELIGKARNRAPVVYLPQFTSKERLIELYKSCDAFVSVHRGEGYGMKILDALACGLPVVLPLFGGPSDFCTEELCYPVDFRMAPLGDCLDNRSLRITNGPYWCEPEQTSVVRQLRRVVEDPGHARELGERARAAVLERFSWDACARGLLDTLMRIEPRRPDGSTSRGRVAEFVERSPYWLGCRMSVLIPTYNRREHLEKCLSALEAQSILPQEFEVVVIDDGSTDGTGDWLAARHYPFRLRYYRQANQGPAAARNLGMREASGELVLFIGDDIVAHPRLLEEHLLAHAEHPEESAAILGHVDWAPHLSPSAVMDFVCGDSTLQFAYKFIPELPTLDFRFFYTSNISLKTRFVREAQATGVEFDTNFRFAAFEDSEYAYRLQHWGLRIHYRADALAYHDHWVDMESFSAREYKAGQMAVVFYRKHPAVDELLQVQWIAEWSDAVHEVFRNDATLEHLKRADEYTDRFLSSSAAALEQFSIAQQKIGVQGLRFPQGSLGDSPVRDLLNRTISLILEVQRMRGKVQEWYAGVADGRQIEAAKILLGLSRKLQFLSGSGEEFRRMQSTIQWLDREVAGGLRARVAALERELAAYGHRLPSNGGVRGRVVSTLRRADLFVQRQLGTRTSTQWLERYRAARGHLRKILHV